MLYVHIRAEMDSELLSKYHDTNPDAKILVLFYVATYTVTVSLNLNLCLARMHSTTDPHVHSKTHK